MSYKITDKCLNCGACSSVCPVDAPYEADNKYEIAETKYIECGLCAADCPANAIEL